MMYEFCCPVREYGQFNQHANGSINIKISNKQEEKKRKEKKRKEKKRKEKKRKERKKLRIFHELSICLTQIDPEHRKEFQTPGLTKQPMHIWHCWLA